MLFDQVEDNDLKEKVESLKRQLDIDSEELSYKWEAWVVKNSLGNAKLEEKTFREFETDLLNSLTRPKKKSKLNTPLGSRRLTSKTPTSPQTHHKLAPTQLTSDIPSSPRYDVYSARTNAGEIVLEEGHIGTLNLPEIDLRVPGAEGYKTMHVKIAESTAVIDRQIEWFLSQLREKYDIPESDICNPAITTQQVSWAIGRIITDKKLGPDSISLQTCRKYGAGTHFPLDPDQLESFSFFPGQLVAFKGTNPNGEKFIVKQQFTLDEPKNISKNDDTSVIIAAGPFTTRDNLDYKPLSDLIGIANEEMPSAIILLGPFVDPTHPLIIAGDVGTAESMAEVFTQRVSPLLEKIKLPSILIPGLNDEVDGHVPFPQPSLSKKRLNIPQGSRCTGNPAEFAINGTTFAITSVDPIQDIARTKYEKGTTSISRPFKHLLDQRNMYPIFPSPRAHVGIDLAHIERAIIDDIPNVLVASSTIKPFVEDIYGVLCINPGLLSKQTAAGTFAKLKVRAGEGKITNRYEVQIVNI